MDCGNRDTPKLSAFRIGHRLSLVLVCEASKMDEFVVMGNVSDPLPDGFIPRHAPHATLGVHILHVLLLCSDAKVGPPIIQSISVDVVNYLARFHGPSKDGLHYSPMCAD